MMVIVRINTPNTVLKVYVYDILKKDDPTHGPLFDEEYHCKTIDDSNRIVGQLIFEYKPIELIINEFK